MDTERERSMRKLTAEPDSVVSAFEALQNLGHSDHLNEVSEDLKKILLTLGEAEEIHTGIALQRMVIETVLGLSDELRNIPAELFFGTDQQRLKTLFAQQNAFSYSPHENIHGMVYWDFLRKQEPFIIKVLLNAGMPLRIRPDQLGELGPYQDQVRWMELYSAQGDPKPEPEAEQRNEVLRNISGVIHHSRGEIFSTLGESDTEEIPGELNIGPVILNGNISPDSLEGRYPHLEISAQNIEGVFGVPWREIEELNLFMITVPAILNGEGNLSLRLRVSSLIQQVDVTLRNRAASHARRIALIVMMNAMLSHHEQLTPSNSDEVRNAIQRLRDYLSERVDTNETEEIIYREEEETNENQGGVSGDIVLNMTEEEFSDVLGHAREVNRLLNEQGEELRNISGVVSHTRREVSNALNRMMGGEEQEENEGQEETHEGLRDEIQEIIAPEEEGSITEENTEPPEVLADVDRPQNEALEFTHEWPEPPPLTLHAPPLSSVIQSVLNEGGEIGRLPARQVAIEAFNAELQNIVRVFITERGSDTRIPIDYISMLQVRIVAVHQQFETDQRQEMLRALEPVMTSAYQQADGMPEVQNQLLEVMSWIGYSQDQRNRIVSRGVVSPDLVFTDEEIRYIETGEVEDFSLNNSHNASVSNTILAEPNDFTVDAPDLYLLSQRIPSVQSLTDKLGLVMASIRHSEVFEESFLQGLRDDFHNALSRVTSVHLQGVLLPVFQNILGEVIGKPQHIAQIRDIMFSFGYSDEEIENAMPEIEGNQRNGSVEYNWRRERLPHNQELRSVHRSWGLMEEELRVLEGVEQTTHIESSRIYILRTHSSLIHSNFSSARVRNIFRPLCEQTLRTVAGNESATVLIANMMESIGFSNAEIERIISQFLSEETQEEAPEDALQEHKHEEKLILPTVDPMSLKLSNLKRLGLLPLNTNDKQQTISILRKVRPLITHCATVGLNARTVLEFISNHFNPAMGMEVPINGTEIESLSFAGLKHMGMGLPDGRGTHTRARYPMGRALQSMRVLKEIILDEESMKEFESLVLPPRDPAIQRIAALKPEEEEAQGEQKNQPEETGSDVQDEESD